MSAKPRCGDAGRMGCHLPASRGVFCHLHHPDAVRARRERRVEKHRARMARFDTASAARDSERVARANLVTALRLCLAQLELTDGESFGWRAATGAAKAALAAEPDDA